MLENSSFYGSGKKREYWAHKRGQMTHRDMLKADIESIMPYCASAKEVYKRLEAIGYTIDNTHEYLTVIAPGWQRPIRMDRLGYTKEYLNSWMDENRNTPGFEYYRMDHPPYKPRKSPIDQMAAQLGFTIEHSHDTATIFVDLLLLLLIEVFRYLDERTDVLLLSPDLRHEAKNVKKFVSEYYFLKSEDLHTMSDIKEYIAQTESDIAELERRRQLADNKRRRAKTPEEKTQYKKERKQITEHIDPLRKKLRRVKDIYERSPRLYDLVKQESDLERQVRERMGQSKTKER